MSDFSGGGSVCPIDLTQNIEELVSSASPENREVLLQYLESVPARLKQKINQNLLGNLVMVLVLTTIMFLLRFLGHYASGTTPLWVRDPELLSLFLFIVLFSSFILWLNDRRQIGRYRRSLKNLKRGNPSYRDLIAFAQETEFHYFALEVNPSVPESGKEESELQMPEIVFPLLIPAETRRREILFLSLFFGFAASLAIFYIFDSMLQNLFHMNTIYIKIGMGLWLSYGLFWLYDHRRWYHVEITSNSLKLIRPGQSTNIPLKDIRLIISVPGIIYKHWGHLCSKYLIIKTDDKTHSLNLGSHSFDAGGVLADMIPNALFIPPVGDLRLPDSMSKRYMLDAANIFIKKALADIAELAFYVTIPFICCLYGCHMFQKPYNNSEGFREFLYILAVVLFIMVVRIRSIYKRYIEIKTC